MKTCSPLLSLGVALALVALLIAPLPAVASEPMAIWPAPFQSVNQMPGGADASWELRRSGLLSGDSGEARQVPIPFAFRLPGSADVFTALNIGSKGYVTFGTHSNYSVASRIAAESLLDATGSRDLIAAWWGNHICDPTTGIKTKTLGTSPKRAFVVEWDGCSKVVGAAGSQAVFQAQIWLMEGSHVVRVKYGEVVVDSRPGWQSLSWGVKAGAAAGFMGLGREGELEVCNPKVERGGLPICGAQHFPSSSVLQYGLSPGIDLSGRLKSTSLELRGASLELLVETTLLNVGDADAQGVGFELSLVDLSTQGPGAGGAVTIFDHPAAEAVGAGASWVVEDLVVTPRLPNGRYRLCASIDPAGQLIEGDRTNNLVCGRESVVIGADLIVTSVTAPGDGEPGAVVSVPVSIENSGTDGAGPFNYRLVLKGAAEDEGEELLVERVEGGLAAGKSLSRTVSAKLPAIIREESYFFELSLDVDREVDESERSNNVGRSATRMVNRRPELKISRPIESLELVDGCYFGEAVTATFELCNEGSAKALDFHPGVIMGSGNRVSVLQDVPAASSPQFCGRPGTKNYTACEPVAGRSASCVLEFCRVECEEDAQCGAVGMRCEDDPALSAALGREVRGCMNYLGPSAAPKDQRCQRYTVSGRIPIEDQYGVAYTEGVQRFHVVDGGWRSLSQPDEDSVAGEPILCRPALLDLAVKEVDAPARVVAGKIAHVSRVIENLGFINPGPDGSTRGESETFTYRYYLSLTDGGGTHQIPVAIPATGGAGVAVIGRKGVDIGRDALLIPPDMKPGQYHLALMLDPEGELAELTKSNNLMVLPQTLTVDPPALQILTTDLPRANLGVQYNHSFVAGLGVGSYRWSAENLPLGMTLSEQGVFQGKPSAVGIFLFTVRVQVAGEVSERLMAFEVLRGQSALEVTTSVLPIAIKESRYARWYDPAAERYQEGARLAAVGGKPPYRWTLDGAAPGSWLPEGLEGPDGEGVISGQATLGAASSRFLVLVEDSLGNVARRWLEIVVVGTDTLVVPRQSFPPATSGMDYGGCVEAQGGQGAYLWSVDPASLPRGLTTETSGPRACLEGMPTECGTFAVRLEVRDGAGQAFAGTSSLEVECGILQLSARSVRPVSRGEEVEFRLLAIPSKSPSFFLHQGTLPDGLSLLVDGIISGRVREDASFGVYDVIVELRDLEGRRSLSALSMIVNTEPSPPLVKERETSGCSSAGSSFASLWGALIWLGLFHQKKPASRTNSDDS